MTTPISSAPPNWVLARHGMRLVKAQTPDEARTALDSETVDILLLDLNYRRGDTSGEAGLAFLKERLAIAPALPVVVVTGHSGMQIAITAMRMGALDFVVKPWNNDRFIASIKAALAAPRMTPQAVKPQDLNLERSRARTDPRGAGAPPVQHFAGRQGPGRYARGAIPADGKAWTLKESFSPSSDRSASSSWGRVAAGPDARALCQCVAVRHGRHPAGGHRPDHAGLFVQPRLAAP